MVHLTLEGALTPLDENSATDFGLHKRQAIVEQGENKE
jgi:hypothetical protein